MRHNESNKQVSEYWELSINNIEITCEQSMPTAMTQGIQMKLIIVYSIFVTDHVNLQNFFE